MLSSTALTGNTTLPVNRNSSTMVMPAMIPSTSGSRLVIACTLSRLPCATPASCTVLSAGVATACSSSSWLADASENSAAVLVTVKNALPSLTPVGAVGGPARRPSTNVPPGADTDDTSDTFDSAAAYRLKSSALTPSASGITTEMLVSGLTAKSLRS